MERVGIFVMQPPLHIGGVKHLKTKFPVFRYSEGLQEGDDILAVASLFGRQQICFAVCEKELITVAVEITGGDKVIMGVRQMHRYLIVDLKLCQVEYGKYADRVAVIRGFYHIDDAFQIMAAVILRHTDKAFCLLPVDALSKFFQQRRIQEGIKEVLPFFRAFDKRGQPLEKSLAFKTKFLQGIDTGLVVNAQDPAGRYIAVTAEDLVRKRIVLLTQ